MSALNFSLAGICGHDLSSRTFEHFIGANPLFAVMATRSLSALLGRGHGGELKRVPNE